MAVGSVVGLVTVVAGVEFDIASGRVKADISCCTGSKLADVPVTADLKAGSWKARAGDGRLMVGDVVLLLVV